MTPTLEGSQTKAKKAPSPSEVRLAPLDTNPIFTDFASIKLKSLGKNPPVDKSAWIKAWQ